MKYQIIDQTGTVINTIVANEAFIEVYCAATGYESVLVPEPIPESKTPTNEERITALEESLAQTDEIAIELYEAQAAQEEINIAQDEALIELYELIGG